MNVRNENRCTFAVTGIGCMGKWDVRPEDLVGKDEISFIGERTPNPDNLIRYNPFCFGKVRTVLIK